MPLIQQFETWKLKKEQLAKIYNLSKSELKQQEINLDALEKEVNILEKELTLQSEIFQQTNQNSILHWQDLRSKLQPDEAAVEIMRINLFDRIWTDSIIYAALIVTKETTDYPELVILPNGRELEKKYFKGYVNAIKHNSMQEVFYKQYWEKINQKLGNKKVIYVSAEGIFNKISLSSLKLSDSKYLLDHKIIKLVPTLRTLITSTTTSHSSDYSAVLFGYPDYNYDLNNLQNFNVVNNCVRSTTEVMQEMEIVQVQDLPGTKLEVEEVNKTLFSNNWKVKLYMGQKATETELKKVASPKILHLATHGYFLDDTFKKRSSKIFGMEKNAVNENSLLRSGLLFTGSNLTLKGNTPAPHNDDGILTAYEAMNIDLYNTELVVLSACETALGEEMNGEGVMGLQRAFQIAGAKNIIMSLWTVSDEGTQKLMSLFYNKLMEINDIPIAFRYAQMELKKQYPSPYFWAAFVLLQSK